MSVKCGSCKGKHETVNDVRDCYAQAQYEAEQAKAEAEMERRSEQWWEERGGAEDDPIERAKWADEDLARETRDIQRREREDDERAYASKPDHQDDLISALEASVRRKRYLDEQEEERAAALLDGMTGAPGRDMASKAQVEYAMDLLEARQWPDTLTRADVSNMERRQVSKLIDGLTRAPFKPGSRATLTAEAWSERVPEGRYALYVRSDETATRQSYWQFFQVDYPTKPIWKGRVFIAQLFGAPGDYRKEPRRGNVGVSIMNRIAKDPKKAMEDFGKQSGICGRCGSPLTNAESLRSGIGPICRGKLAW